ncbi:hypothetical protein BDZ45DRAFT_678569 [Acephala macrosclerotiorum]|nr:hypothetical protein BDZ45DRAFT_678569 [Acephala macrosclerotiorum]
MNLYSSYEQDNPCFDHSQNRVSLFGDFQGFLALSISTYPLKFELRFHPRHPPQDVQLSHSNMSTPSPLQDAHSKPPSSVSVKTIHIAGILTDIYGLEELSPSCKIISCLWLLHPRLQKKETMASVASSCISDWNYRASSDSKGLIAVAFDQRNHGTRCVDELANEAWRSGNVRHAQDMWSIISGTALDTTLLIDHLAAYIFHGPDDPILDQHFVLGISLGGHAAWQVLFNEPRVIAAVVIIGCPDYMRKCFISRASSSLMFTYSHFDFLVKGTRGSIGLQLGSSESRSCHPGGYLAIVLCY